MTTLKILTITAGLSEPSSTTLLGEELGEAALKSIETLGLSAEITPLPLRSIATEITNHYLTGFPTGKLAQALDWVRESDAIIAVSPTFKASYTGLFKSFWDLVDDKSMASKPVLAAATGGTARHSLMIDAAMRPLFGYFHAHVIPTGVFAATNDFGADTSLQRRIDRAGAELAQILGWKVGAQATVAEKTSSATVSTDPINPTLEESFDDANGANSGDLFGLAVEKPSPGNSRGERKVAGLRPLSVTPFEQLLKGN